MSYLKQVSAKKAWANLAEKARLGQKFGFIACLGLLYKAGKLSRGEVLEALKDGHVTRQDLASFRHTIGTDDPGVPGAESGLEV